MDLTIVLLIIAIGVLLVLVEIFLIPGVGVVGFVAAALLITGIYFAYTINSFTGHLVFGGTVLISLLLLIYSLRAKTWERLSVKGEISSRVNEINVTEIKTGDEGKTIARPMGKAEINGNIYEVSSNEGIVDPDTTVYVYKIDGNKIIVKPKTT
jgi:membrane-bound ClpP family serine protease